MRTDREIRLYGKFGNFARCIGEEEAWRLIRHGKATEIYQRQHGKPKMFVGVRMIDPGTTNSPDSVTSLTESDARAVAGLHGTSKTSNLTEYGKELRKFRILQEQGEVVPIDDFIELACCKFEQWPFVGDDKAVRVGPLPA